MINADQIWWPTPCNPSDLGGRGGRITRSKIQTILANMAKPCQLNMQKSAKHGGANIGYSGGLGKRIA